MARLSMVEAINVTLHELMARDERIVVLGEDVGKDGGVFRATVGLLDKFGPMRVIDTPLAESCIVGSAIGMAVYGMRPVAEIQFEGFMFKAYDQVYSHASRLRRRSQGVYGVPLVIRAPYGAGVRALEHHSDAPEALFAHVPGLKVVIPATPSDAKGLLTSSIEDPDTVIFLEPKRLYRLFKEEVPEGDYRVPLGEARVVQEGDDATIVTYGGMVSVCERAAQHVASEGVSAEVIDLRTVWPFDIDAITKSVTKTGRLIICHEAPRSLGVGAEIAAQVAEKCLLSLQAPIVRVTGNDVIPPLSKLEEYNYPDSEQVVRAIHETVQF
ncbi:MAG: alpha-ketoacid dehydrogenase subunit beta [Desulfomonile tiedjei]|uniref:Alpha-ketoacid dehydrogenase subunit beta n=1 Tax=Desulfomonile tiedjei TaxID=2358 RepID=A0A9D6V9T7_9BACT|nr:alpha-ketoacid dehydrogenase subunit beta [Desulfomonile tiedjei]